MRLTTKSSSRKTRGPSRSWCRPWRSSSPRRAVSRPASCARSKRHPSPCVSPPICHVVSIRWNPDRQKFWQRKFDFYVPRNNILVLPADLVAQTANGAVLAAGLQSEDTEGLGNDHLLLLVVRGGDTLEDLESLKSSGATGSLVRGHATDSLVEDAGRGAEMEGTYGKSDSRSSTSGKEYRDSPPRVGLYRVILRRYEWYLTVSKCQSFRLPKRARPFGSDSRAPILLRQSPAPGYHDCQTPKVGSKWRV